MQMQERPILAPLGLFVRDIDVPLFLFFMPGNKYAVVIILCLLNLYVSYICIPLIF